MARVVVIGSLPQSLLNFRGPLLKSMVDRGHEVHALSPPAQTEVVDGLAAIGVRHHAYPLVRTGLNPLQDLGTGRALVQIVRGLQPDCLLAYTVKAVIYGGLAARIAHVPRYYALISGLGYTFSGKGIKSRLVGALVRPLYRFSLSHAAHVFFQNADNLEVFESAGLLAGPEQAVLVNGSGVDLTHFAPVPLPSEPAFLMVGRLLREKGVLEYVAAARAVKARHPDAVFRLAGWIDPHPDAIKQADLDAWIEEGVIEFLGYLDDVRPAIAEASVYCLPSYHEGMPRTVLEAMAMGRPIVTTDVPGCRLTVAGGDNGVMVPMADADALAIALEHFVLSPDQRSEMGMASRKRAEALFDVHKVNGDMLAAMRL